MFRIREATREDQRALADLESTSPQGDTLQILIEREDYFYRSHLLDRGKVLLAEEDGRVVGVMAFALKDILLSGAPTRAAEEGIQHLTAFSYLDPPGTPLPRRFVGKLLRYRTMVKPIAAPLPGGPLYLDVRDA